MTEDNSPENLRKFLKSDDPGLRGMGLSMAKGSGVPEDLYKNVLGLSLWDPEEGNRKIAAAVVKKIGLKNISEFPRWLEPFDKKDVDRRVRQDAAEVLGKIGDMQVIGLLIGVLSTENYEVCKSAAGALGKIGKPAIEPLIEVLSDKSPLQWVREFAAEALWKIGEPAAEPLIKALGEDLWKFLKSKDLVLVRIGLLMAKGGVPDERLGEILMMYMFHNDKTIRASAKSTFIKLAPEDAKQAVKENWKASYRDSWMRKPGSIGMIAWFDQTSILGKALCHTSVSLVGPLIKELEEGSQFAARALGGIGDEEAVEPLIKTLGGEYLHRFYKDVDDSTPAFAAIIQTKELLLKTAAEALGEIGDVRAVKPLIKTFEDENLDLIKVAAKAIVKIKENDIGDEKENIIKFLESDDLGMVKMGASMLKGILK